MEKIGCKGHRRDKKKKEKIQQLGKKRRKIESKTIEVISFNVRLEHLLSLGLTHASQMLKNMANG